MPAWSLTVPAGGSEGIGRASSAAVAAALLVATSPLLGLIYVAHRIVERGEGPFLYRGVRLGRGRRPFVIRKIRTLAPGSERRFGAEPYAPEDGAHSRFGDFLRRTHLDELPQLLNVLVGDMSFVGPRPERPRVYDLHCRHLPGYDDRFGRRPGLTGISQLVTPHGAPKRIRAWLDRRFAGRSPSLARELRILLGTVPVIALRTAAEIVAALRDEWRARRASRGGGRTRGNARLERRVPGRELRVQVGGARGPADPMDAQLVDISRTAMRVRFDEPFAPDLELELIVEAVYRSGGRHKRLRCRAVVLAARAGRDRTPGLRDLVLAYEPVSPLHRYLFDQYVLRESLRPPA